MEQSLEPTIFEQLIGLLVNNEILVVSVIFGGYCTLFPFVSEHREEGFQLIKIILLVFFVFFGSLFFFLTGSNFLFWMFLIMSVGFVGLFLAYGKPQHRSKKFGEKILDSVEEIDMIINKIGYAILGAKRQNNFPVVFDSIVKMVDGGLDGILESISDLCRSKNQRDTRLSLFEPKLDGTFSILDQVGFNNLGNLTTGIGSLRHQGHINGIAGYAVHHRQDVIIYNLEKDTSEARHFWCRVFKGEEAKGSIICVVINENVGDESNNVMGVLNFTSGILTKESGDAIYKVMTLFKNKIEAILYYKNTLILKKSIIDRRILPPVQP